MDEAVIDVDDMVLVCSVGEDDCVIVYVMDMVALGARLALA